MMRRHWGQGFEENQQGNGEDTGLYGMPKLETIKELPALGPLRTLRHKVLSFTSFEDWWFMFLGPSILSQRNKLRKPLDL